VIETAHESSPGTYALLLSLKQEVHLQVGALGGYTFSPGLYVYIGSAFGPGGLRGRLCHHLRLAPRPHWHIDYLRQAAQIEQIWYTSHNACEHAWAKMIQKMPGSSIPVLRFGSSGCRCPAHLFGFPPSLSSAALLSLARSNLCPPITMVLNPRSSSL
jgi:Uri superfamily endonuclease